MTAANTNTTVGQRLVFAVITPGGADGVVHIAYIEGSVADLITFRHSCDH